MVLSSKMVSSANIASLLSSTLVLVVPFICGGFVVVTGCSVVGGETTSTGVVVVGTGGAGDAQCLLLCLLLMEKVEQLLMLFVKVLKMKAVPLLLCLAVFGNGFC